MKESTIREKVLKKVRNALVHKAPMPFPHLDWTKPDLKTIASDNLAVVFSEQWMKAGGLFFYCANMVEVLETLIKLGSVNDWDSVICACPPLEPFLQEIDFPHESGRKPKHPNDVMIIEPEFLVAKEGLVLLTTSLGLSANEEFSAKNIIVLANRDHMVGEWKSLIESGWGNNTQNWPSMVYSIHGNYKTLDQNLNTITSSFGPKHLMVIFCDHGTIEGNA